MHQCVEAIERMSIPVPSLKRKSWDGDYEERTAKRMAYQDHPDHKHPPTDHSPMPQGIVMPAPGDLRRASNGHIASPQRPTVPEPPKKRGRPSRVDKAKRDLRPILPQPRIPPRPVSADAYSVPSPGGFRPIQPALLPALNIAVAHPSTPTGPYPPAARQVRSPPATSPNSRVQGSPSDDALHPALCKAERPAGLPESSAMRVLVE